MYSEFMSWTKFVANKASSKISSSVLNCLASPRCIERALFIRSRISFSISVLNFGGVKWRGSVAGMLSARVEELSSCGTEVSTLADGVEVISATDSVWVTPFETA